ncbi:Abi family protein [Loigolactobacillus backii]|uniref:Uncharacterized protein n=1 Tax=Loigolactobacillus backii TaxID=375175 RepID=A0A192H4L8_9LACO|nr:Abi family protein [Loigolactobacillus backii]ANK59518.1 hypothetical protein AYR52_04210 [Loigolactobacillus backii]ANK62921.1 hypothetical protein AYR53_09195 [Loigolactobacillus backii]ANK67093.1 hypothetical protein AYR55_04815 [Loigolactobacillus backii]ANK70071.1 hypothetical protein AYR56_07810 [Loigolactobacillus backii]MDA5387053.1 Abi family protein [Loigolactobacillus backii]
MAHYTRKATTIDEQIAILAQRGLAITNDKTTIQKLENIGYFKFKGYCFPFYATKDKFALKDADKGTKYTFEEIYQSYILDQKIHLLFFGLASRIETQFKARLGCYIATNYGPLGYQDDSLFRNEKLFNNWLVTLNSGQKNATMRHELYVQHYQHDYENDFPIWVVLEMSSFGNASKLYSDISIADQKKFAKVYGQNYVYVKSWIHYMVTVRNYCAHNSRTFRRQFPVTPRIDNKEKRRTNKLTSGNLFSALFVAKKMCKSKNFFEDTVDLLAQAFATFPLVDISYFGFPSDWRVILDALSV